MANNFWWLFAAYGVIWVFLFAFVMRLLSRQGELRRDLDQLRQRIGS